MLKKWDELRKVDVSPYCDERDGKDDRGKPIKLQYLNWAKAVDLLHENGAEKVDWGVCFGSDGSSLIKTDKSFVDSKGNTNAVYETRVWVEVDGDHWEMQGPVMNGSNPVKDNSMSQQRLWNAQTRLFVKAVAIHTGLGFELWSKTEEQEEQIQRGEDFYHDIRQVKNRVFETVTALQKMGLSLADIAEKLNKSEPELKNYLSQYDILFAIENNLEYLRKQLSNDSRS